MRFEIDSWLWLSWMGAAVAGGLLFGLATWLPFKRPREVNDWLFRADWFFEAPAQTALAVLTGVAIASGVRMKRSDAVGPHT